MNRLGQGISGASLKEQQAETVDGRSGKEGDSSGWWDDLSISAAATSNMAEVEQAWRQLEGRGIQSPGQSLDFTRAWIRRFDIPAERQLYVTGVANGKVVALMPLWRTKMLGADVLTWFAGSHVGCNAPLIDREELAALDSMGRTKLWQRMGRAMFGADLAYMPAMPRLDGACMFDELGTGAPEEYLYRAEFENWQECERMQRTKSRRKHDKQQITKLRALGEVEFREFGPGKEALELIDKMFAQKACRFEQLGIKDPFADERTREFYKDMFRENSELGSRLQTLNLDGEMIAARYNLFHGDRFFVLITSMSEQEKIRPGSPGKQSTLFAIRSVFEAGFRVYDIGAGHSDEKKRWCNRKYPLDTRYFALTKKGMMVAGMHMFKVRVRRLIKENEVLFSLFKTMRAAFNRKN